MTSRFLRKLAWLVVAISSIPFLGYLLLLGASSARVSGGLAVGPQNLIENNFVWSQLDQARRTLPRLPRPNVTRVDRLEASDAFRNLVYIFCVSGLTAIFLVVFFIGALVKTVIGLVTGDWGGFGIGVVAAVLTPVFAVGFALFSLFIWISLLFQPCTPGYAVAWIVLGLPVFMAGVPVGAAPLITVVVIVRS